MARTAKHNDATATVAFWEQRAALKPNPNLPIFLKQDRSALRCTEDRQKLQNVHQLHNSKACGPALLTFSANTEAADALKVFTRELCIIEDPQRWPLPHVRRSERGRKRVWVGNVREGARRTKRKRQGRVLGHQTSGPCPGLARIAWHAADNGALAWLDWTDRADIPQFLDPPRTTQHVPLQAHARALAFLLECGFFYSEGLHGADSLTSALRSLDSPPSVRDSAPSSALSFLLFFFCSEFVFSFSPFLFIL